MKLPTISQHKASRARVAEAAFAAQYLEFQYRFVDFFVEHLGDLSQVFKGDLQMMLALAVVGQVKIRTVHDAIMAGVSPAEADLLANGITASRIAEIISIPRQTVRRKLAQLRDLGWVEQNPDQTWCISSRGGPNSVRRDLAEVDSRAIARVAGLFAGLEGLVTARRKGAQNEHGPDSRERSLCP